VFCSKCGGAVADGSPFCPNCGQATHAAPLMVAAGPLQSAPARPYAGFWLRVLAYIIDALILGIFCGPIFFGLAMSMGLVSSLSRLPRGSDPFGVIAPAVFVSFFGAIFMVALVGGWLYHALLESSEWQGTAGKKALGLTVTDMAGQRVSFGRASGRHFGKLVTGLIPLGIGYALAGFTEKKQALHDMMASCLVMRQS
jgi:uncharacterized RDD family membrane protein YckC